MKQVFLNKTVIFIVLLILSTINVFAGPGGIDTVTADLLTYVDSIGDLLLAIGAIVGLVGGVRVYIKWNNGDNDVQKAIMGWVGSCIFLLLVGGVINAFFVV